MGRNNKAGKVIASSKMWKDGRPVYGVTNMNKYGAFTSTVSPCDEDMDNLSDFIGYQLCERKNFIKMTHRKALNLKERAKGILNTYEALSEKYDKTRYPVEHSDSFLDDLMHQYLVACKQYFKVYDQYKYMRDDYYDFADRIIQKHAKDKQYAEKYRAKLTEQKAVQVTEDSHDIVTEN